MVCIYNYIFYLIQILVLHNYQILNENLNKISLDENKLNQYLKISKDLLASKNIEGKVTINKILSLPDLINSSPISSSISYKRILSKGLNDAVNDLIAMRKKEGQNLTSDIKIRLNVYIYI